MRDVEARWAKGKLGQDIEVAGHRIRADEEVEKAATIPARRRTSSCSRRSALCTAMTLKVYAERKGWPLEDVKVTLNGAKGEGGYIITRQVAMHGELDAEQRQRLLEIADKCPVHRTLMGEITINTTQGDV